MDSIEKLVRFYNFSDENDMYHNVVGCVLHHLDKVNTVSIYDMADLCYSSASTMSRMVKLLGFQNYQEFKSKINYALRNYRELNRHMPEVGIRRDTDTISAYLHFVATNILALEDDLDHEKIAKISDCFHDAGEIFLYSYPEAQIHSLQKDLILSGKNAYYYDTISAAEKSVERIGSNAAVFAVIPNLIEMSPFRGILRRASEKGAVVISVCSDYQNHYKRYSDIQLSFSGTRTSMDLYQFMIIANIIRDDYSSRYLEETLDEF